MFERFTGRARHAVVLAQEEARRLQHNYIGTEHILLGVLGEPEGVAARALENFGLSLETGRREVAAIVSPGPAAPSGHIPFTPRAKKTLELALREALQLSHNYIGTEHILLGLMREGEGVAAQVLREHGDLLAIRSAVLDQLAAGSYQAPRGRRWLRRRGSAVPSEPGAAAEQSLNATPAADTTLSEATRLRRRPAGRLPSPAARRPGRLRLRRGQGPGGPRRRPGPGQGGTARRGHHRYQRRAAGGSRPPPDGHPGDQRTAHHRGSRPGDHQGRPGRARRAGCGGQPARHHPRRPARLRQPEHRLAGAARWPHRHPAARGAAHRVPGTPDTPGTEAA